MQQQQIHCTKIKTVQNEHLFTTIQSFLLFCPEAWHLFSMTISLWNFLYLEVSFHLEIVYYISKRKKTFWIKKSIGPFFCERRSLSSLNYKTAILAVKWSNYSILCAGRMFDMPALSHLNPMPLENVFLHINIT
jgi:hypothetical protein